MNNDYTPKFSSIRAATYLELISYLRAHGYEIVIDNSIFGKLCDGKRIGYQLVTHSSNVVKNLKQWVECVEQGEEIEEALRNG